MWESIKTSLATFKEQEIKINDIVSKTKEIMGFVHNFKQFEDRIDKGLGELYKKDTQMTNEFTGRLNLLDDLQIKSDSRLLVLERSSTVMKQELASHKL